MSIPKIIHQTWKTSEVPENWKKSPEEWKRLHPNWTYKLWTDADNRNLIATKYSWFLPIYDGYPYPIQRADAVRYFILHSEGGVYSDLDLYPVAPIDPYVSDSSSEEAYFVSSQSSSSYFTNSFMASKPGASIWIKVFEKLSENRVPWWARLTKHFYIMLTTGPIMLDCVIRNQALNTIGYLPRIRFSNYDYNDKHKCNDGNYNQCDDGITVLLPLYGSSWCSIDSYIFNMLNLYKTQLAVIGVIVILLIIVLLIVFIFRYIKFKNMFNKCRKRANDCFAQKQKTL